MPSPVRLISLATAVPPFVLGQEEVMAKPRRYSGAGARRSRA